jgi:hypothetical protein
MVSKHPTTHIEHSQARYSGPITQARARQLNNQVSSFLASYSSYLDNGNMCCLGTTDRNETELHSRWRHSDSRTAAVVMAAPTTYGL